MVKRNIRFQIDATDGVQFQADRQQLVQVLINLAQNAADSMPRGGTVTLRARTGAATLALNPPGIGRNSFRGPQYFSVDMAVGKQFGFPRLNETTKLDLRFNFFNAFNMLNLQALGFSDPGVDVRSPNFGRSQRGLAGRVIEFQARLSF